MAPFEVVAPGEFTETDAVISTLTFPVEGLGAVLVMVVVVGALFTGCTSTLERLLPNPAVVDVNTAVMPRVTADVNAVVH